jgi:glucose/arabinose dehydrogenase
VITDRALAHTVVASGLVEPWGLALMPDGRWLVTERPGRLRIVAADGTVSAPVAGLPAVDPRGQGGLLDVILGPDFADDRMIWWSYAEPREGGNATSVARGRLSEDGSRVENVQVIFRALPTYDGTMHYGSSLAFAPDGRLFVTLGERSVAEMRPQAQDLGSHMGKTIRIEADGSVPQDNPFVGREGALPEIWSSGHRNVQGIAIAPDGAVWTIEHGTRGGDELNLDRAGLNYGWPVIAYGIEYRGGAINEGVTAREGMEQPVYYWDPVIAPGGMTFYQGAMFPEWNGDLLVVALKEKHIARLVLENGRVVGEERLLTDLGERVRDVAVGPDGAVWAITDEENGKLVRLAAR